MDRGSSAQIHVPASHWLLAIKVMAIWGTNFVVIKIALVQLAPLLLATLRFAFTFLPAALIVGKPPVSWRNLATYGMLIGGGQFGLLFLAMKGEITPGLASLVVQTQVFFTIGLSLWLHRERASRMVVGSLGLAVIGLGVIALHTGGSATPLGLALVIAAAFFWSAGNMVSKAAATKEMLGYVVWSSICAVPPLFLLTLMFEGVQATARWLLEASAGTWAAVAWQAGANTMLGYAIWGWLLARYQAVQIAPMALLVPVFGLASSSLVLGEPLQDWKLIAGALIIGGLALSAFGTRPPKTGAMSQNAHQTD